MGMSSPVSQWVIKEMRGSGGREAGREILISLMLGRAHYKLLDGADAEEETGPLHSALYTGEILQEQRL